MPQRLLTTAVQVAAVFGLASCYSPKIAGSSAGNGLLSPAATCNSAAVARRPFLAGVAVTCLGCVRAADAATGAAARDKAATAPKVTDKAFVEVRIMEPLREENGYSSSKAYRGVVEVGLYGEDAPQCVENFLRFVSARAASDEPSYSSGILTRLEPGVVVEGGRIKGLNSITLAGATELEYQGQVLPLKPILEANAIPHDRRGLLTKRRFTSGPEFGITLGKSPELDGQRTVFGRVLKGLEVLDALERVPTYGAGSTQEEGSLADAVFRNQKAAFRNLGQMLGDERAVDRTGQFLRRVDISNCGLLPK